MFRVKQEVPRAKAGAALTSTMRFLPAGVLPAPQPSGCLHVRVCVRVCVHARVRACMRVCVCTCVIVSFDSLGRMISLLQITQALPKALF